MLNRKLGSLEQAWAMMDDFVPVLFVGVLHLSSGPTIKVLRDALGILQRNHPLLRTCLENRNGNYHFCEVEDPPQIPLTVIERAGREHWCKVAEGELNTAIDTSAPPLLRCTYLVGKNESEFIFTIHHSIVDSRAGLAMVHQLLTQCADLGDGRSFDTDYSSRDALPAMQDLYPSQYKGWLKIWHITAFIARQMIEEASYRLRLKGRQPLHADAATSNRILCMELPRDLTNALAKKARKHRIPLNSLMQAVMLLSLARHRYSGQQLPMRGISFANMRPYLKPPPENEDLGVYISMLHYTISMSPDLDIWQLASEINDHIYKATKYSDKFIAPLLSNRLVQMLTTRRSMRLGMAALSYAGPLDLKPAYGNIELLKLSGFISNNFLGPELAAFATIVHGRLAMDFIYLDSDMSDAEAGKIVADIRQILLALAERPQQGQS